MSKPFEQLQDDISKLINEIERVRLSQALAISQTAIAKIIDRILETGKKADGEEFDGYSEAVVPYWFFKGRGTKRNAYKDGLKKYGYHFSYKQFRDISGRQTEHKDFSLTGEMWRDTSSITDYEDGEIITVTIYPKRSDNQNKIDWNSSRDGRLLELSSSEEQDLENDFVDGFVELVDKYKIFE